MRWATSYKSLPAVHLHARGPNPFGPPSAPWTCGSPPRAWRQSAACSPRRRARRLTSTRAQTMPLRPRAPRPCAVHLHARGDNAAVAYRLLGGFGSPPRAWRQFEHGAVGGDVTWFTSTRVETISLTALRGWNHTVHLHARGDNSRFIAT